MTHCFIIIFYLVPNVGHRQAITQEDKNVYKHSIYQRLEISPFYIRNTYKCI